MDTAHGSSQGRISAAGSLVVSGRTLDSLVFEEQLRPPQVIKIDVEGHEEAALRGALRTLEKYRPIVLCDYNDERTLSMMQTLFAPLSYHITPGPPVIALPRQ